MGQPLTPITGEAARRALTPGQTGPATEREAATSRAALDEQELRDLEAHQLYDVSPKPVLPAPHRQSLMDRILRRR